MSKMLEKASKMVSAQARELLCAVAGPRGWNDTREAWLAKAARRLGFGHRRTKAIFYGEARVISAEEWMRLQDEFSALTRSAQQRQETLHELSILARSVPPPAVAHPRPLDVESNPTGEARPWGKRGS